MEPVPDPLQVRDDLPVSADGENSIAPHQRMARPVSWPLAVNKTKTISNDCLQSSI